MGAAAIGTELSGLVYEWENQGDRVARALSRAYEWTESDRVFFTHDGEANFVEIERDGLSFLPGNTNPGSVDPWCHPKRQTGRPGKVARKVLTDAGMNGITDDDIEAFASRVNAHRQEQSGAFRLLRGKEIAAAYRNPTGPYSCMKGKPVGYFDLYTKNPDTVGMLVLERDGVLVARAMVWETTERGTFMDRVYTGSGGAMRAMTNEAMRRDWCFWQHTRTAIRLPDATVTEDAALTVPLTQAEFARYPYVDTMRYLHLDGRRLSSKEGGHQYALYSQEGNRYRANY